MAKAVTAEWPAAKEDDDIRQQIAQFAIEVGGEKIQRPARLTKRLKGQQPGAEASIGKLISTELVQRMTKFPCGCSATTRRLTAIAVRAGWRLDAADTLVRVDDDRGRHLAGAEKHDRRTILLLPKG